MTFTLRLVNDGPAPVTAAVSTTFPADLGTARSAGLDGGPAPGGALTFTLPATLAEGLPPGTVVPHTAHIALAEQGIVFSRTAWVRAGAPDLGPRRWDAGLPAEPGAAVTCTLRLENGGPPTRSLRRRRSRAPLLTGVPRTLEVPGASWALVWPASCGRRGHPDPDVHAAGGDRVCGGLSGGRGWGPVGAGGLGRSSPLAGVSAGGDEVPVGGSQSAHGAPRAGDASRRGEAGRCPMPPTGQFPADTETTTLPDTPPPAECHPVPPPRPAGPAGPGCR